MSKRLYSRYTKNNITMLEWRCKHKFIVIWVMIQIQIYTHYVKMISFLIWVWVNKCVLDNFYWTDDAKAKLYARLISENMISFLIWIWVNKWVLDRNHWFDDVKANLYARWVSLIEIVPGLPFASYSTTHKFFYMENSSLYS